MESVTETTYYILKAAMKDGSAKFLCVDPERFLISGLKTTDKAKDAEPWDEIPENLEEIKERCRENQEIERIIPVEVTEKVTTVVNFREIEKG